MAEEDIEGDYLDESFVISSFGTSRLTCGGRYFLGFKVGQFVYGTTAEQEAAFNAKIVEIIHANGWAALSGYDQVKAVYDWVCANVAYDHEHFDACDSFSHLDELTVPLQESYLPHTAYNGLFAGKCVCSGYTQLLYAFYSKLGVDCRIISGSAAFKGASLTYIFIPATAVTIAEDAFEGCTGMAIVGVSGSYAQEYAQAHGFAFIAQE